MSELKSVVVTGASTGIGYGIAKVLGGRGLRVFGCVRKQADADRLQRELGGSFVPVQMDVTDERGVSEAAATVAAQLGDQTLFGLVNNAGVAGGGPLLHQPIAEFRQTLEVNLVGPFTVIKAFGPLLERTIPGRAARGALCRSARWAGGLGHHFWAPMWLPSLG